MSYLLRNQHRSYAAKLGGGNNSKVSTSRLYQNPNSLSASIAPGMPRLSSNRGGQVQMQRQQSQQQVKQPPQQKRVQGVISIEEGKCQSDI
jgi:hypothetical protein